MTGWAQVNGFRGETKTVADMEARVRQDIYYVENWSLLLDLKILLMTLVICVTGRNAY
jgi:lipopolysaccharide/colanic/teichoic acid biosynthesis glycosyltransferase